ncbi:MAG: glycosyl hydrolase [Burkholderiaceae bacterium]|nr:glycosyl hydrolase [Burkholderiaceae bacterium]
MNSLLLCGRGGVRRRALLLMSLAAGALGARAAVPASPSPWRDVLDTPAQKSALASRALLTGLARACQRLVAVGQRGHVLLSDDAGKSWQQADVPVSADLVAVQFPTPTAGWAVGHDGVVLHSADAGKTWTRQLDGRSLGEVLLAHYSRAGDDKWLAEAKRFAAQGAENPFLDVWFDDARHGTIVGAFGLALRTADGGKSWEPLLHATDNPKALHLYAVRRIGAELFIAGEQGLALRLDRASSRFTALTLPYPGTLFGLVGKERTVLAHGLRGNIVRSIDGGASWMPVATGVGVGLTASTVDERGRLVIVSQAGHVLVSSDDGASFAPARVERPFPAAAVVSGGAGTLIVAGPRGVQSLSLA